MKIGETVPVTIAGQVVAQAEITELGDGRATLKVPGTWVVMATKTELTDDKRDVGGVSTVVIGNEEKPVETPTKIDTPEVKVPLEGAGTVAAAVENPALDTNAAKDNDGTS